MLSINKKDVREMPVIVKDTDLERFWNKVKKGGENDCWEWQGTIKNGYGQFKFGRIGYIAHRVAYFLNYKVDPLQNLCCHSCDNRKCVNPNHIFLGSQDDNYQDAVNKNRATVLKGKNHMNAKLNEQNVMDIISEYSNGNITQAQLGEKYGVDGKYIDVVLKGRVWKHVECERIKTINPLVIKLTEQKVHNILKEHFIDGLTYSELIKKYDVSRGVISNIIKGKIWRKVCRIINGVNCIRKENLSFSKLDATKVSEIKKIYAEGNMSYQELSKIYNVDDESIRRIIKGITWRKVA